MSLFHKHKFKLATDGHQLYCTCGKIKCIHKWKRLRERRYSETSAFGISDIVEVELQCIHCGIIKNQEL